MKYKLSIHENIIIMRIFMKDLLLDVEKCKQYFSNDIFMEDLFLDVEKYEQYQTWNEYFSDGIVNLKNINYHYSWKKLFDELFDNPKMKTLEETLSEDMSEENVKMYPKPKLLFNAFNLTPLHNVKVVIIGQDPYFSDSQAMGLSFSVPFGIDIPSSLSNIYKNLMDFNHLKKIPTHGNLEFWAIQGCLLLNSSLTVKDGSSNKNCHSKIWKFFTDSVIKYVSDNCDSLVFVMWGRDAYSKINLIDVDKHKVITSSHPSGLSFNKTMGNFQSFESVDHFGKINEYLAEFNNGNKDKTILWRL